MPPVRVAIERLPHGADLPLPTAATAGSAGVDLLAALEATVKLEPGRRCVVPTGIRIALPEGWEGQIRPRSGLALRHGLTVLNAPGTIDADYRGEVGVIVANLGEAPVAIRRGMRVAQLVVAPVATVEWQEGPVATDTVRGAGGYGSTGSG